MRRAGLLLVLVVLAGCVSETTVSTTTTGASDAATTSTRPTQSLVPGGLIPADPATLIPFEDAEPVLVGRSHRGVVSPNGRWAVVATTLEADGSETNIIDLETLDVARTTEGSGDGMVIDDDGLAVWFEEGSLRGLAVGEEWPDLEYPGPVPPALYPTLTIFEDGRIGYLTGSDNDIGATNVVLVEGSTPTLIGVVGAQSGPVATTEPALPSRDYVAPAVAWDQPRNRAFVVSATANEVFEVDLETGETETHQFETANIPGEQGVGRDVYLNEAGTVLLVATRVLEVDGNAEEWTARDLADDLAIIDTTAWTTSNVTQSIWALVPALDGSQVAGMGASITWDSSGATETLQSPVYLIDGVTGQPMVGFEGRSGTIADTQFSADSGEMYVISEGPDGTNIDIVDVATEELAGSLAFTRISLVGEAGLVAFHAD